VTTDNARAGRRQDSLIFEVTQRCNHDCLHCYNAWKNESPYPDAPELSTAETLALLDKVLDETGAGHVTLTGGEPLLREDLPALVEHLNARHCEVNLITNGTRLDEATIARLTPDRISIFEVPLLSAEAALHDRLSGAEGAYDKVTMAIADLKLAGQTVVCVFVATALNLSTWAETLELAFALGADGVMFNRFNPGGEGFRNLDLLQPSPEALRTALDVAQELSAAYALSVSCSIAMPPCLFEYERWPGLTFGFCAAGTADAYYTLDPAGNLRPCNHSMIILGNLRERSFWELADSPAMRNFVAARPGFCDGCRLADECLGGCKAAAEVCYGRLTASDPFLRAYGSEARKLT
jgi:radical SAM protein with 4Fe4S-binding SPASM domain